jgi:hypothetical protein
MKRYIYFSFVAWLILGYSAFAAVDYSSPNVDPRGICDQMSYSPSDYFGQLIHTIPCVNPGTNNAWVGEVFVNGELIQFKNIYSGAPQFLRLNHFTGAIIATINLPFNGYVMDGCFDGSGFWIAQWSPTNVIHKISLTGVELTSFVPVTGGYSARCVNWDGTYLWVGCDSSANHTKLIKMTTAGVNVQEWQTGTAVGWYMGGEIAYNESSGSNLYVVDNVGNTIKRLNVGTTVSVGAQVASPATAPDVAEGLTYDGYGLWNNGAYASLGLIWNFQSAVIYETPFYIYLTPVNPPVIVPARGGSFSFNVTVQRAFWPGPIVVWTRIGYPDGTYTDPILGPVTINPPDGVTRMRTQNIPGTWPSGEYVYYGYANLTFSYPGIMGCFGFSKADSGLNDPWITDASCTGEPFTGEEPPPLLMGDRGDFVVASPNPFNPTTAISFKLQAPSYVNLKVYDTTGRLVATLADGWREAGTQALTFDGSGLASGIYLYILVIGDHKTTGKMMLLK